MDEERAVSIVHEFIHSKFRVYFKAATSTISVRPALPQQPPPSQRKVGRARGIAPPLAKAPSKSRAHLSPKPEVLQFWSGAVPRPSSGPSSPPFSIWPPTGPRPPH